MSKSNKAFLLFEVLVAVVVLAVCITLVLRSFNSSVSAVKGLDDYLTAVSLMEQKMFELDKDGLNSALTEGDFEAGSKRFSWKIDYSPVQESELYKVDLAIIWDTTKTLSAQTYLREPLSQ